MINFNLKSFFKDNVIPLSITLIIIIYFIYTWIFYYQGYDFNMFLLNYFSKIVDFTEYFFPVKYIAAYIRGEATWEVAQPFILHPVRIQNLISSMPLVLLMITGIEPILAFFIISILTSLIANIYIKKIFDKIINNFFIVKLFLLAGLNFLIFHSLFRSYVNHWEIISTILCVSYTIRIFENYNLKYLNYIGILAFLSLFSYIFSALFIYSVFVLIIIYLIFLSKMSFSKLFKYLVIPLAGVLIFSCFILYTSSYENFNIYYNFYASVSSILPSISLLQFFTLVLFILTGIFFIYVFKDKISICFLILSFALFIAHFHTLITHRAIQEGWHFGGMKLFMVMLFFINSVKFIVNKKFSFLKKIFLGLMLFLLIKFSNSSGLINMNILIDFNEKDLILKGISDCKKKGFLSNKKVITEDESVYYFYNPYPYNTTYFNSIAFNEVFSIKGLSFLTSNQINKNMIRKSLHFYFMAFAHHYLTCVVNYERFYLCKVLKSNDLCEFYNKNLNFVDREKLKMLFKNNDSIINLFKNHYMFKKIDSIICEVLKEPQKIINKYKINYAIVNKQNLKWWEERTHFNKVDSINEYYVIKFIF